MPEAGARVVKILVTGHEGYIGSVLAPMLVEAGHEVVGIDTGFYEDCAFLPERMSIATWRMDVRDVTAADLEGFGAVVHLAALSNDPVGSLNSEWTFAINLEGTLSLARAAKQAGAERFVFASSCSMYGASDADALLDEGAELRPLTAYAETKVRAEEGLRGLADATFSPVSMRNATAYGVSPRLRLDVVLNNLAAWAHTTRRIRLLSDGSAWRPLVHVEDIARTTVALLGAPREIVHDQAFNVGSEQQNVRIRDLAEILHVLLGCDVEMGEDAAPDPRSYRVDFSKLARALPELRLEWTIERGAEELVRAYEERGLTFGDFQDAGRYTRIAELERLLARAELDDELRWREDRAEVGERA
jgi:nucleoside-diphosphate-sugar epimerase